MMKWIGAALIVLGCGSCGFALAASHRKQEQELRQFIGALDYMQCELQYRMTPLPDLCRQTAAQVSGYLRTLFSLLAQELEDQIAPDVGQCMNSAIAKCGSLTDNVSKIAITLGRTLGRFDLDGQLIGLENARRDCRRAVDALSENRDNRLRCYQTLGLCAGAALAILFI